MDIIQELTNKEDKKAYEFTKIIASKSEQTNEYYKYMDDFISLLDNEKSYIRTRAFILICSQAKWDNNNLINKALPLMYKLFNDEKPTVVRQCLKAIKEIIIYKPELSKEIKKNIEKIDLSQYKESMTPLIKKDINEVMELIKS